MLVFLFNKVLGLQAGNFTKKKLQHRRFPMNIANFNNAYFEKHLRTAGSDSSYILHIAKLFRKRLAFQICFLFFLKRKTTVFTFIRIHL